MTNDQARSICPPPRNPYYIVAHRYMQTSAGKRTPHLLCHHLNLQGQVAYLVLTSYSAAPVGPDLLTPVLTPAIVRYHYEKGLTPIVVYGEVVRGNPLRADCVVRYLLNFPGLLGGAASYDPSELLYGYSGVLAEAVGAPENVLMVPTVDASVFHPGARDQPRSGTCFYAAKYKTILGGCVSDEMRGSVEITLDYPATQTEIADLFRRSELLYCYENTALALEAMLCGCPAVFMPNPHLTEIIALRELGRDGVAWGTDPAEIARAKATVHRVRESYLRVCDEYWHQLDRFIQVTQDRVRPLGYRQPVRLPLHPVRLIQDGLDLALGGWDSFRRHVRPAYWQVKRQLKRPRG
jgi:hypothetical protein